VLTLDLSLHRSRSHYGFERDTYVESDLKTVEAILKICWRLLHSHFIPHVEQGIMVLPKY